MNEPRPADPPRRMWRDWVLLAVVWSASVLEVVLRANRAWLWAALLVSAVIGLSLLLRRSSPLVAVVVAFGTLLVWELARIVAIDVSGLVTIGVVLVLAYALLRWGAGREIAYGLAVIFVWLALTHVADPTGVAEVVAGYGFFLFAAALGAAVRLHANSRLRDIEQAKLRLRNDLARELHDTVGHHVSGIAIQAQAGRAMAGVDPERALAVLATIEEAASHTLKEMRAMVGVLRDHSETRLAPQRGLGDVERLARDGDDGWPRVDVQLSGDLEGLASPVSAALYRLSQEAVTNALRHARNATGVTVNIDGDTDQVRLRVQNDGDRVAAGTFTQGYGLVGMTERVSLLGGTVTVGPLASGGWLVDVSLPKDGVFAPRFNTSGWPS